MAEIFWGNFTLDHCLEDDVVVIELVDPRVKSLEFLVHIFRVVDVKMTVRGKAGWAVHYSVVEGIQKDARRQLVEVRTQISLASKQQQVSNLCSANRFLKACVRCAGAGQSQKLKKCFGPAIEKETCSYIENGSF